MRKTNYNFVLQPNTVGEFLKRLNRLLSVTGCLSNHTVYHSKELGNITTERSYIKVEQSQPSYLLKDKIVIDTYPSQLSRNYILSYNAYSNAEGIIIRIHEDACIVYYWGQKFKFTPSQIKTVGIAKINAYRRISKTQRNSTSIYNIFSNIDKAENINYMEVQYARSYYDEFIDEPY